MQADAGRLALQLHDPGVAGRLPGVADARDREHDRDARVDPPERDDQLGGTVDVAAGEGVIDHDVRLLRQDAVAAVEDGAGVGGRSAALLHLVSEPAEGLDLLVGEVDVVVDDECSGHGAPSMGAGSRDAARVAVPDVSEGCASPPGSEVTKVTARLRSALRAPARPGS